MQQGLNLSWELAKATHKVPTISYSIMEYAKEKLDALIRTTPKLSV
jgi:hypothetical protein